MSSPLMASTRLHALHREPKDAPALSHYKNTSHPGPDIRALCGTQLIGVKAPADSSVCVVCKDLLWRDNGGGLQ